MFTLNACFLWICYTMVILQFPCDNQSMCQHIQKNYSSLKEEVYPHEIADELYSKDVISFGDMERFGEATTRRDKCDILFKAIVKVLKNTDDNLAQRVFNAFSNKDYGHLFDVSEETEKGMALDNNDCYGHRT